MQSYYFPKVKHFLRYSIGLEMVTTRNFFRLRIKKSKNKKCTKMLRCTMGEVGKRHSGKNASSKVWID